MNSPLLSILIPTKNRYEYLIEVVKSILKIDSTEFEVVLQDNSNSDDNKADFLEYLRNISDQRIKYFYFADHLSVVENCDRAVLNSSGRYVCLIGDDDCVAFQILDAARWMEKDSIDVLTFNCPTYIWSDVKFKYLSEKHTGALSYHMPDGKISVMNPKAELKKLLDHGGQFIKDLPQFYHSIVSRKTLDEIYRKTGSYFPGSSPDMAVAVALALNVNKHIKLDAPVVISGTAKKSAGGMGASKTHKGELTRMEHLPCDTVKSWNHFVPFFWSGPTIYADSVYQCLIRTGNKKMAESLNFNFLYAMLFIFNNDYYKEIRKAIKLNKSSSMVKIIYYSLRLFMIRTYYFIRNRIPFLLKSNYITIRIATISEATSYLEEIISNLSLPWSKHTITELKK